MKFELTITTLSPLHLGSGKADVNLDAEIVHDEFGIPYFPAKRFRGLLSESALELTEMPGLAAQAFANPKIFKELFNQVENSPVTLTITNFYPENYFSLRQDFAYLQTCYSEVLQAQDVLNYYTSIRYQTKIDPNGIADDGSLRNLRVIDSQVCFWGELDLSGASSEHKQLLAVALQNLRYAGAKRNRGFGQIKCTIADEQKMSQLLELALGKR